MYFGEPLVALVGWTTLGVATSVSPPRVRLLQIFPCVWRGLHRFAMHHYIGEFTVVALEQLPGTRTVPTSHSLPIFMEHVASLDVALLRWRLSGRICELDDAGVATPLKNPGPCRIATFSNTGSLEEACALCTGTICVSERQQFVVSPPQTLVALAGLCISTLGPGRICGLDNLGAVTTAVRLLLVFSTTGSCPGRICGLDHAGCGDPVRLLQVSPLQVHFAALWRCAQTIWCP